MKFTRRIKKESSRKSRRELEAELELYKQKSRYYQMVNLAWGNAVLNAAMIGSISNDAQNDIYDFKNAEMDVIHDKIYNNKA